MRPAIVILSALIALGLIILIVHFVSSGSNEELSEHSPVVVQENPVQTEIDNPVSWTKSSYEILPLARYDIRARVVGIEYYNYGREAGLSPVDFALGWGPMSDMTILSKFRISQSKRWCTWSAEKSPIPIQEVLEHSANVHIVPSSTSLMKILGDIRIGDIVRIRGKLIEARGSDGWTWRSSLTRTDTGDQSCEIIWVESLELQSRPGV